MIPYSQHISEYQYSQLEFPWVVLSQASHNSQILERRFSFLKFYPFSKQEIIDQPLYESGRKISDFYYKNERPIDNINYFSRYTWTLDNSKDAQGDYIDKEWIFNKYKGWEKTTFNYTHIGNYIPTNVGYLKWGFLDNIVINSKNNSVNETDPIELNLELDFSIKTSTITINPHLIFNSSITNFTNNMYNSNSNSVYKVIKTFKGSFVEYLIPIGDVSYSIEVKYLEPQVKCYWTNELGEEDLEIAKGKRFIQNTHLKVIIPNIRSVQPTVQFSNSKLMTSTRETYKSPGYIEIYFYGYKIHRTINLANPKFIDTFYELYEPDTEINLSDPWPNYPKIPLDLKSYLT